jgi:hypothetical protein
VQASQRGVLTTDVSAGAANHISQEMKKARFHLVFLAEAITPVLIAFFISYLTSFALFG